MTVTLADLFARAAALENELVDLTCKLIQAQTENDGRPDAGNEILAAPVIEAALAGTGVEIKRLARSPRRTNVLARLKGESGRARLGLLSHSDVVPAGDEKIWTYPPFGGTVVNGRIYGRGASDMKGIAACQTMALRILAEAGVTLTDDLLMVCAADEEAGGAYGMGWLAEQHPDEIRVDFALNEGGGSRYVINGVPHYTLCFGEKGRLRVTFRLKGKGAHAARPWHGVNALYQLEELLGRIRAQDWGLDLNGPLFQALVQVIGWTGALNPDTFPAFLDRLATIDPHLASQARATAMHTFTPTVVAGGSASNSVPDQAVLTCDIRLVPGLPLHDVEATLHAMADAIPGATVTIERVALPTASPDDPVWVRAMENALLEAAGREARLLPAITVGFTDARFLRHFGIPVYNFTPQAPDSVGEYRRSHGPDEFTTVADLRFLTRFYLAVAYDMLVKR